ncbi:MAG: hypothetical protein AB7S38_37065 [Vulcanimicrobiota bacterium]
MLVINRTPPILPRRAHEPTRPAPAQTEELPQQDQLELSPQKPSVGTRAVVAGLKAMVATGMALVSNLICGGGLGGMVAAVGTGIAATGGYQAIAGGENWVDKVIPGVAAGVYISAAANQFGPVGGLAVAVGSSVLVGVGTAINEARKEKYGFRC